MKHVKSPVLFWGSMVLIVVVLGFVADRTLFLMHALRTTGNVVDLSASNARCSCGRHCSYDCTKFRAQVRFDSIHGPAALWVSAGSAHGYDCPVSLARYRIDAPVNVAYNGRNPAEAYRDTFDDIWGTPLMVFFAQIVTFIASFTDRRHRSAGASA